MVFMKAGGGVGGASVRSSKGVFAEPEKVLLLLLLLLLLLYAIGEKHRAINGAIVRRHAIGDGVLRPTKAASSLKSKSWQVSTFCGLNR